MRTAQRPGHFGDAPTELGGRVDRADDLRGVPQIDQDGDADGAGEIVPRADASRGRRNVADSQAATQCGDSGLGRRAERGLQAVDGFRGKQWT